MRRVFIWLLVIVFVSSIVVAGVACKEEAAEETVQEEETSEEAAPAEEAEVTEGEKPFEGTTIKVITFQMGHQQTIGDLVPRFEEETGIDVVYDIIPYNDVREKMLTLSAAHSYEYDVLWLDTIWVPEFANAGFLYDVSEWIERDWDEIDVDDFPENFWDYCLRYDDKWIGLPSSGHYGIYVYRKDLFEQFGLKPPESMKDQEEIARTLTTEIDGEQIYGTAFRYARGNYIASDFCHFTGAYADYDNIFLGWFHPDMTPAFNEPAMLRALNDYFYYYENNLVPPGSENFEFPDIMNSFNQGTVATIATENWACAPLVDPETSDFADSIGFYTPPGYLKEDGTIEWSPYSGGIFPFSISSDSPNKEAAWEFLKWASSKDIQEDYMAGEGVAYRLSVMEDPDMQAKYPWIEFLPKVIATGSYRPLIPEFAVIQDIVGLELSRALLGEISKEDALKTINEKVTEVLDKAGYYE